MSHQSFLEPFNAKTMSYSDVARTFVPSTKFAHLAGPWNSVLVGPRGSGKTTLLKMLSVEGQEAWTGPSAAQYAKPLGYTGVYIPSDIAWGTMLDSLRATDQGERLGVLFSQAAFVTHVLLAVAASLERHVSRHPPRRSGSADGLESESHLSTTQADLERAVKVIAEMWRIRPVSLSPASLVDVLRVRLLDIKRDAHLQTQLNESGRALHDYLGLDMLESVSQALQTFDAAYGREDHRWCLLFDEFEVAPMHLQKTVLNAMRASGAQKVLLKVALAPCGPDLLYEQQTNSPPSQINDVQQVELWYADKAEASEFCRHVFLSRTSAYPSLREKSPTDVLGSSAYAVVDDTSELEQADLFTESSTKEKRQVSDQFFALASKDPSFVEFLRRKQIDLHTQFGMLPSDPHGNTLRKIAPLVAFRNAYRGKGAGSKRGVKPFNAAYSGWESISAISEGNPRWLIGLITRIMAQSEQSKLPVPSSQQTAAVQWNCQRYADMLQAVANEQFGSIRTSKSVFDVLSKIGRYFHDRLVTADFVEDTPMSFVVDDKVDEDVEHALRIAMNHGAIVCFEAAAEVGGFRTLRGRRFRLTYLLAPVFKLPMRKSRDVSLSTILDGKSERLTQETVPTIEKQAEWTQVGLWAS